MIQIDPLFTILAGAATLVIGALLLYGFSLADPGRKK